MAQMLIRPTDKLKKDLVEQAHQMGVTLNAFVILILQNWLKHENKINRPPNAENGGQKDGLRRR